MILRVNGLARVGATLMALVVLGACGNYEGVFRYTPSPAQVLLEDEGEVLAAVEGLRTIGEENSEQYVFDVRLRFDHRSAAAAWTFDPASATLVTGGLEKLEQIMGAAVPPLVIEPGTTRDAALVFALPLGVGPDDLNLTGLHLTLRLARAAGEGTISAGFERRVEVVSYHGYGPHWSPWPYWHDAWYRTDVYYVVPRRRRRNRR